MNTPQKQFDQKLRALMPQVDKRAEREARFRQYLKDTFMPRFGLSEDELFIKAAEQFGKWRTQGVDGEYWFWGVIPAFQRWWAIEISKKRSNARKPDESEVAQSAASPPAKESSKPIRNAPKRKTKSNASKKPLLGRK